MARSSFFKDYWAYRKNGGEMPMKAYVQAVKDSLTETKTGKIFVEKVAFSPKTKQKNEDEIKKMADELWEEIGV